MRVSVTMSFDDEMREAISNHYGYATKATREECRMWMCGTLFATMEDLTFDFSKAIHEALEAAIGEDHGPDQSLRK